MTSAAGQIFLNVATIYSIITLFKSLSMVLISTSIEHFNTDSEGRISISFRLLIF